MASCCTFAFFGHWYLFLLVSNYYFQDFTKAFWPCMYFFFYRLTWQLPARVLLLKLQFFALKMFYHMLLLGGRTRKLKRLEWAGSSRVVLGASVRSLGRTTSRECSPQRKRKTCRECAFFFYGMQGMFCSLGGTTLID